MTPATGFDACVQLQTDAALAAVPWKNGGGLTRELAVFPPGSGYDSFIWRASIAELHAPGAFSRFAGIDRQIALLDGNGFTMTLDDNHIHALTTPFAPFAFAGEAQVHAELHGGASRDFNLMVRRTHASGELAVWRGALRQAVPADTVLLYMARGAARLEAHRAAARQEPDGRTGALGHAAQEGAHAAHAYDLCAGVSARLHPAPHTTWWYRSADHTTLLLAVRIRLHKEKPDHAR